MISVEKAIQIVLGKSGPVSVETVDLDTAMGRVLAEEIVADTDLPPFNRAQMDGFALRSADASRVPVRLTIVGESAAGSGWHEVLQSGEAVRINREPMPPIDAIASFGFESEIAVIHHAGRNLRLFAN